MARIRLQDAMPFPANVANQHRTLSDLHGGSRRPHTLVLCSRFLLRFRGSGRSEVLHHHLSVVSRRREGEKRPNPCFHRENAFRDPFGGAAVFDRDIQTITVECLPVQGCDPSVFRSGVLCEALKRIHPSPYPLPLGPCFRTLGEALGTFQRYTWSRAYAGIAVIPVVSL